MYLRIQKDATLDVTEGEMNISNRVRTKAHIYALIRQDHRASRADTNHTSMGFLPVSLFTAVRQKHAHIALGSLYPP